MLWQKKRTIPEIDPLFWEEGYEITFAEIFRIVKREKMKNNTASGPDGIRSIY